MAELKCEFPEGCSLSILAKVIKARFMQRQAKVLDTVFCVPDEQVGGKVACVEDIKVKVLNAQEDFCFNKVKISIDYEVILFVIVEGEYQIITVSDCYDKTIELDEFDPPLAVDEFKNEVEQSEIILRNWSFDFEIKGDCEDPCNPCCLTTPIIGTCIGLRVYVDIIDKLYKTHDIIVYGELDPDAEM